MGSAITGAQIADQLGTRLEPCIRAGRLLASASIRENEAGDWLTQIRDCDPTVKRRDLARAETKLEPLEW